MSNIKKESLKKTILLLDASIRKNKKELLELQYKLSLFDYHRFSEETCNFGTKRKPNIHLVKFGHYNQSFKDDDYPDKPVVVERRNPVEIDGKKCDQNYNLLDL